MNKSTDPARNHIVRVLPIVAFALFGVLLFGQEHHSAHWGYDGAVAPQHWGDLSPEFSRCKTGREQSPINITNAASATLPPIEFHYSPVPLKIIDNGHTVQVNYAPGSYIVVANKRYDLVQFHFHHPSEEEINGKRSDVEIHLVHKDSQGNLAVVAVLLAEGPGNAATQGVFDHLPAVKEREVPAGTTVNAADLLPSDRSYYTFSGSLTTPPCTEGVRWFVLQTPSTLSKSALEKLATLYPNNARPVQPLNGRIVKK